MNNESLRFVKTQAPLMDWGGPAGSFRIASASAGVKIEHGSRMTAGLSVGGEASAPGEGSTSAGVSEDSVEVEGDSSTWTIPPRLQASIKQLISIRNEYFRIFFIFSSSQIMKRAFPRCYLFLKLYPFPFLYYSKKFPANYQNILNTEKIELPIRIIFEVRIICERISSGWWNNMK
jgi:hypothetical protein